MSPPVTQASIVLEQVFYLQLLTGSLVGFLVSAWFLLFARWRIIQFNINNPYCYLWLRVGVFTTLVLGCCFIYSIVGLAFQAYEPPFLQAWFNTLRIVIWSAMIIALILPSYIAHAVAGVHLSGNTKESRG